MSAVLEPGMWVECRQNRLPTTLPPRGLIVGRVYRVEAAGITPADDSSPLVPWVRLVGVPTRPDRWGFRAAWFRPVLSPKSEIIQSLLQPAPVREKEHA